MTRVDVVKCLDLSDLDTNTVYNVNISIIILNHLKLF